MNVVHQKQDCKNKFSRGKYLIPNSHRVAGDVKRRVQYVVEHFHLVADQKTFKRSLVWTSQTAD